MLYTWKVTCYYTARKNGFREGSFREESESVSKGLEDSSITDSLSYSRAYWVSRSVIAWNVDAVGGSCFLYSSSSAALTIVETVIEGYNLFVELKRYDQRLPESVRDKLPHIRDYKAFKVPTALDPKTILKDQLVVAFFDGYYLRRNADGFIENSTCVNNTASEHFIVDRLIVDDLLNRACNYKMRAKSLLRNLSRDKDEVDGSSMVKVGTLVKWQTMVVA
ncbi:Immunoglobulin E-set [Cynara cardunculus var. scolymus]|uniref:Immunoglobulin E-set n=1 Tax=Cynara cardunculus var. scolymus TaxID=59895 RepID=A0A124SED0_CYNCS|nr:Immunoglobulin E-set [Cynara cardunculus var. scolymus]